MNDLGPDSARSEGTSTPPPKPCSARLGSDGLAHIAADLDCNGYALLPGLLTETECQGLSGLYEHPEIFRSQVVMERHAFGRGEYRYFAYPLPALVAELRAALYRPLSQVANRWQAKLSRDIRYPEEHADYLAQCHAAGQTRPTPLLLTYGAGDYNRLHQDIYGDLVFPLQAAVLLSEPGRDFSGGAFVLTEQRARVQTRAHVLPLRQGDAVIFPVKDRPVDGVRGPYRTQHRHGVSTVDSGRRNTLGIIFHDASG